MRFLASLIGRSIAEVGAYIRIFFSFRALRLKDFRCYAAVPVYPGSVLIEWDVRGCVYIVVGKDRLPGQAKGVLLSIDRAGADIEVSFVGIGRRIVQKATVGRPAYLASAMLVPVQRHSFHNTYKGPHVLVSAFPSLHMKKLPAIKYRHLVTKQHQNISLNLPNFSANEI